MYCNDKSLSPGVMVKIHDMHQYHSVLKLSHAPPTLYNITIQLSINHYQCLYCSLQKLNWTRHYKKNYISNH